MTTVKRYRSTKLEFFSDATSKTRQRPSSSSNLIENIPPAVPSPPRPSIESPQSDRHTSPIFSPTLKMAFAESAQWYFTDAEVASTPSVVDGLTPAEERCRRAKGVNFIIQAGILLKLPQLTLATASVFFHRFFMRFSMCVEKGPDAIHHYNVAATALFLATKTEENCRKTKEIVIAVAKVAQKNAALVIDEQSKEYWRWRDNILLHEELMLEYLTFDVALTSPYAVLYDFVQRLHIEDCKSLRNYAWAFLNDSCLTTLCLLMLPKDIAIAAIYFAAKFAGETIPDDANGSPWWEQLGGDPDKITKATGILHDLWTENPLRRASNPFGDTSSGEDDLHRTRRSAGSITDTPSPETPAVNGKSVEGIAKRKTPNPEDEPEAKRLKISEEPEARMVKASEEPASKAAKVPEDEPEAKTVKDDEESEEGELEE